MTEVSALSDKYQPEGKYVYLEKLFLRLSPIVFFSEGRNLKINVMYFYILNFRSSEFIAPQTEPLTKGSRFEIPHLVHTEILRSFQHNGPLIQRRLHRTFWQKQQLLVNSQLVI